jgi:hypothetical protein
MMIGSRQQRPEGGKIMKARASTSDKRAAGSGASRVTRLGSSLRGPTAKVAAMSGQAVGTARRVATDQTVRAEMQRAIADASHAARRAQRVGPTRALSDKHLARQLRRASRHASKAATLAVHPRRNRVRRAAFMLVGSGALVGAAYGGWRRYAPPPEQPV